MDRLTAIYVYPGPTVLGCQEAYKGSVPGDVIWPVVGPLKGGRFLSACAMCHYLCALASDILLVSEGVYDVERTALLLYEGCG